MILLIDMNMSPRWVEFLATSGFKAVHWSSVGSPTASDAEIMNYAKEHNHVVLTCDLDFSAILAASQGDTPSVVQLRLGDLSPEAVGQHVVLTLRQVVSDLEEGALVSVGVGSSRIRRLPLGRSDS